MDLKELINSKCLLEKLLSISILKMINLYFIIGKKKENIKFNLPIDKKDI